MIYARPGSIAEAILTDAPAGLVGQLTFRLIDPSDGSVEIAESTAGISEPLDGNYYHAFTAPTTQDTYLIVWRDPTTDPDMLISEELRVTFDSPAEASGPYLITRDEYKVAVGIPLSESGQDSKIDQAIAWASDATRSYTNRDFATTEDPTATTRRYRYDGRGFLEVDDLVTGSVEAVAVDGMTLPVDSYGVEPSDPGYPVQSWLEMPPGFGISPEMGFMRNLDKLDYRRWPRASFVEVTARWGWATVPGMVKQAVVWIAASFMDNPRPVVSKSVADVSYTYPNPNNDLIPDRAKVALDYYVRPQMGAA